MSEKTSGWTEPIARHIGALITAQTLFQDLDVKLEVRNQARVHLWFADRFGADDPPLHSAKDGINPLLICSTCVGLDIVTGELYAPTG